MDDGGDGREAAGPDDGSDPPRLTQETRRALEAIIMVAADPVPPQMLAQLLEVAVERVEQECAELAAGYQAEGRGFVLVRVADAGSPAPEAAAARGTAVAARMRESGVLIKDVGRMHPMLHNCLRLTVGTPEENRQMLLALRQALSLAPSDSVRR